MIDRSTNRLAMPLGNDDSQLTVQMELFVRNTARALAPRMDGAPSCRGAYSRFKRLLDVGLALVGLVLVFPVIALVVLFVKLTSRGPVFCSQVRLGLDGRLFRIYKIRSMYLNSEARSGPCWSAKFDPRVTPIGRFLRWSRVDELPQLWNIFIGDMSLIGPRPECPEMLPVLEKAIPRYRERLMVRPGLPGLAQIQLPRMKLAHDLCYLRYLSFGLDCRIFLATILHVLGLPAGPTRQLFALPGLDFASTASDPGAGQRAIVPNLQAV
jgi:lipopolysaccharide/colanic/teichoic acid biosynthesis glycosyltransferase